MKLSDFILPFLVSSAIHGGALSSGALHRDAEIVFEKGASAVTLNIVSSAAGKASSSMPEEKIAAAEPIVKKNAPAQPSPSGEIVHQKASPIQDVALHPKKEPVAEQYTRRIQQKDETVGPADPPPEPHVNGSKNSKNHNGDQKKKGVTGPAIVTDLLKPKYPRYSRIHGEEGTVVLSVEAHANGRPENIQVVSSSGYRRLDSAAVKALEKATFIPGRIDGKTIALKKRIAFRFDLSD